MGGSRRIWVVDNGGGRVSGTMRSSPGGGAWARCALGDVSVAFPAPPVVASLEGSPAGAGRHERAHAGGAGGWYLFDRIEGRAGASPLAGGEAVAAALTAFGRWLDALGAEHPGAYRRWLAGGREAAFEADLARGPRLVGRLLLRPSGLYALCASHDDHDGRRADAQRFVDSLRVEG